MIRKFLVWILKLKPEIQIVEVEKPRPLAELDEDAKKSVITLAGHPGFQYLVAKLKLQKSALQTRLQSSRFENMQDVLLLQSGVFWTGWLETQVSRAVFGTQTTAKPKPAMDMELQAFQEAQAALEQVGGDSKYGSGRS